ncbi:MAG: DUF305 domain-containing protein [Phormidesmis sp.]
MAQMPGHTMPMGDRLSVENHAMTTDLGPKDAEFDLRFIDGMVLHHEGAIAMAKAVLQNSQRPEMEQLAQNIVAAQQSEIEKMQQWRQAWYPEADAEPMMHDAQMGHTMRMSAEMQAAMRMNSDLGKADDGFDLRFVEGMVPHHEEALVMAEQALKNSDRPEIQQIAQDILTTQQAEIEQMNKLKEGFAKIE